METNSKAISAMSILRQKILHIHPTPSPHWGPTWKIHMGNMHFRLKPNKTSTCRIWKELWKYNERRHTDPTTLDHEAQIKERHTPSESNRPNKQKLGPPTPTSQHRQQRTEQTHDAQYMITTETQKTPNGQKSRKCPATNKQPEQNTNQTTEPNLP